MSGEDIYGKKYELELIKTNAKTPIFAKTDLVSF